MEDPTPIAAPAAPARPQRPRLKARVRAALSRFWSRIPPGRRARRASTWALIALAAVLSAFGGWFIRPGLPGVLDPLSGIAFAFVTSALLFLAIFLGLKLLLLLPRFLSVVSIALLITTAFVLQEFGIPTGPGLLAAVALGLVEILLVVSAATLARGFRGLRPWRKVATPLVLALTIVANAAVLRFVFGRGDAADPYPPDPGPSAAASRVAPLDRPDPSLPGSYRVTSLTYGSGTDRRRPEFGRAAVLRTAPVDVSKLVDVTKGWKGAARRRFWGFAADAAPVNGRVWAPEGAGPFPLVLMVHGNHKMEQFSDPGYEYLGRLLASRGYIAVSVDENFFNGSFLSSWSKENDGRGWMLLQHLKCWRQWNATPGNPFCGRVDLGRVALVGHSRGGEAAAVAAFFNRLSRYPDDATIAFDFGFGVKAVVAIAPIDGQYEPAGRPTPMEDVSYLLLQGDYDSDLSFFSGDRVYRRARYTAPGTGFKASVYVHRANHGQFNTVWGDNDAGFPRGFLLNRGPLLPARDQRKVAEVYISAFLDAAVKGGTDYLPLFRDARAGAAWLPKTTYVTRFQDSTFRPLADYEEDVDVTTASVPGAAIAGRGLKLWKEMDLPFRSRGTKENQVAVLGWRAAAGAATGAAATAAEAPVYEITLPESAPAALGLDLGSVLTFSLADADQDPPADEKKAEKGGGKKAPVRDRAAAKPAPDVAKPGKDKAPEKRLPPDLTIEVEAADGARASLRLSAFQPVPPILKTRFTKIPNEAAFFGKSSECTLQTFRVPVAAFVENRPDLRPGSIRALRFVFDRGEKGSVVLDDIGFGRE